MKIKRFFAKDMRAALAEVKEVLGPDAVIMSNKKVTGGIEIVAAVDFAEAQEKQKDSPKNEGERQLSDDSVNLSTSKFNFKKLMGKEMQAQSQESQSQSESSDSLASLLARQQAHKKQMSQAMDEQNGVGEGMWDSSSFLPSSQGGTFPPSSDQRERKLPHSREPFSREQHSPEPYGRDQYGQAPATLAEQNELRDGAKGFSHRGTTGKGKAFAPVTPKGDNQKEISAMKAELASIRKLLEHQVSGLQWQEVERNEPVRALLIKELAKIGFTEELADRFVNCITESSSVEGAWQELQQLLIANIQIASDDILKKGGAVALVGPTGVGKTTTIAKLAAKFALLHGADNVAMITTDTYRIGAHEQLSTYGRIMGCTVKVARDEAELAQYLYQLRNKRLVLIDTAGMGQRDTRLTEQLGTLVNNNKVIIRNYLVIPATAQRRVIQETIEHFHQIPLSGCILSKVDESLSLGEVISVLMENELPVTYITNGQRVPEDIDSANAKELILAALDLNSTEQQNETHFWLGNDNT